MDIKELRIIINSDLPDEVIKSQIINSLAMDENVIPVVMSILDRERVFKKELTINMNLELSRAHIYIEMRPERKSESKENFNKKFVMDEISKFYLKYKPFVTHCFNRFN
jgi:hypothetical protein